MNEHPERLVFYDGDCGFCNSSVQFILKKRKKDFYFTALQSDFAKAQLQNFDITINMDTIYFLENGRLHERSSAALRITRHLKGLYPLMMMFMIIPPFIRNGVYNAIAKRRHRLRSGYCAIPTENEKKLFLD